MSPVPSSCEMPRGNVRRFNMLISESDHQHSEFSRSLGRVISRLNRLRKRYMTEHLRQYGLTGPLYMFLTTLDKVPGASQDYLCERFYMDKGNVARGAKRLVELGYIVRETDPRDRRQNNLYLTESGRELVPTIYHLLKEWSYIMSADLSDDERKMALDLLERMMENSTKFFTDSQNETK